MKCKTCGSDHMTYLGTYPVPYARFDGPPAAHYQCNHCGVKVMTAVAVASPSNTHARGL
jgi:DNA-directed RNA polymerase subunit RPC12/RpoP